MAKHKDSLPQDPPDPLDNCAQCGAPLDPEGEKDDGFFCGEPCKERYRAEQKQFDEAMVADWQEMERLKREGD